MRTVNIHEAKTHLSRLVDQAAKGEPFVIAKAGKPLVKVVALDAPAKAPIRRVGFLEGQYTIPDDFDRILIAQATVEDHVADLRPHRGALSGAGAGGLILWGGRAPRYIRRMGLRRATL